MNFKWLRLIRELQYQNKTNYFRIQNFEQIKLTSLPTSLKVLHYPALLTPAGHELPEEKNGILQ